MKSPPLQRASRWVAERRRWILWDGLGIALALTLALPSLWYPFGIDQPLHWYIGSEWLEGVMPYQSAISTRPPGAFVVHAIGVLFFGDHEWVLRILDLAFAVLGGLMVATLTLRRRAPDGTVFTLHPPSPGVRGAAVLCVVVLNLVYFDYAHTGHPELWQGVFMLMPAWLLIRSPDFDISPRTAFWAGAAAAAGVTMKHTAALTGFVAGAWMVWMALRRTGPKRALVDSVTYTGGVLAVLLLTVLPFVLTGTWDGFHEWMIEEPLDRATWKPRTELAWPRWFEPGYGGPAVLAGLAGLATWLGAARMGRDRDTARAAWFVLAMTGVSVLSIVIQRRTFHGDPGFSYHFIAFVPFLALGLISGLGRVFRRGSNVLLAMVLLAGCAMASHPSMVSQPEHHYEAEWESWWAYVHGERSFQEHHAPHQVGRRDSTIAVAELARWVNTHKQPGDTLCVDGWLPQIYVHTDLRCPSRYIVGEHVHDEADRIREHDRVLETARPTFIITYPGRPRRAQMEALGYQATPFLTSQRVQYTILERPRSR